MARKKSEKSTPGDHLRDSLRAPRKALRRAAKKQIPLLETSCVAALGLLGLGWSTSGLLWPDETAFEAAVLGGLQGLALTVPLLLFVAAVNALQAPTGTGGASIKQSAAITATAMVLPGVVTLACGFAALALPLFVEGAAAAAAPAAVAVVTWGLGVVGMTGLGHALAGNTSRLAGIASAVGALLIVAFVCWLGWTIWSDPPWGTEQPWGFL